MVRIVVGAIVGVISAFVTVWIVQLVGHVVFPPPANLDPADTEAFRAYVDSLPLGALLFVLASYLFAAFDGTFVGCLVARSKHHLLAIGVGGLMLAATIANLIMIPHPAWFVAIAVIGIPLASYLAAVLAKKVFRAADTE